MFVNEFGRDPVKIALVDPLADKVTNTYVALGTNTPPAVYSACVNYVSNDKNNKLLREYYGPHFADKLLLKRDDLSKIGGAFSVDFDMSDIDTLLKEGTRKEEKMAGQLNYDIETDIWGEDNFAELKDKIHVITGIPSYRQHLFYYKDNVITTTYEFFLDGPYEVNARKMKDEKDKLFGKIPIDKFLFNHRASISVDALDTFGLLSLSRADNNTFYVIDISHTLRHHRSQLLEVANDSYSLGVLYYGFAVKYWPQFTLDIFKSYILDEKEVQFNYPLLSKNLAALKNKHRLESGIINYNYNNAPKAGDSFDSSITSAILTNNIVSVILNLRNLFDLFETTEQMPEVQVFEEYEGEKFLLRKKHVRNTDEIHFNSSILFKQGLTVAIKVGRKYIFLNVRKSGKYYVKMDWNEEEKMNFGEILRSVKSTIDPLLRIINEMKPSIFVTGKQLTPLTEANVIYQSINICYYWKRVISGGAMKEVRKFLEDYVKANIVVQKSTQHIGQKEFAWKKGTYDYDYHKFKKILMSARIKFDGNQYAHLSDELIRQKWEQNYSGRNMLLQHRASDVRFSFEGLKKDESELIRHYLIHFVDYCESNINFSGESAAGKVKKLRKLREFDPNLFDIKKFGSDKVYSTICQQNYQPVIYSQKEVNAMSDREAKKLTKYWNFTTEKPAFYSCPNPKYPALGFIVGVHPLNYCLPCCYKKKEFNEAKAEILDKCLKNHKFEGQKEKISPKHVVQYGKTIETDRLGSPQRGPFSDLIHGTAPPASGKMKPEYFLYGVDQEKLGVEGGKILNSLAACLGAKSGKEVMSKIIAQLSADKSQFYILQGGKLPEYFDGADDLLASLNHIFILSRLPPIRDESFGWLELIVEMAFTFLKKVTFLFIDDKIGGGVELFLPLYLAKLIKSANADEYEYVVINKRFSDINPLFLIDPAEYYKDGKIMLTKFARSHPLIEVIFSMAVREIDAQNKFVARKTTVDGLRKLGEIKKLLVNSEDSTYAVIISGKKGPAYVGVEYEMIHGVGKKTFAPFSFDGEYLLSALLEFVDACECTLINFRTSSPYFALKSVDGIYNYFNVKDAEWSGKEENIDIDYLDFNRAVAQKDNPDGRRAAKTSEVIYTNYIYKIFMMEFVARIGAERNEEIRGQIYNLVKTVSSRKEKTKFRELLRAILLPAYPVDYAIMLNQIRQNSHMKKNELVAVIEDTNYDFDQKTFGRLEALKADKSELVAACAELAREFCEEGSVDFASFEFPNIYNPCSETGKGYCEGGKLIVPSIAELSALLAEDIINPLKNAQILSLVRLKNTINYFKFIKRMSEKITIIKLQ